MDGIKSCDWSSPTPLRPALPTSKSRRRRVYAPESFPAKVAALLYQRFQAVGGDPARGLIFLPCELIERNGEQLKEHVLRHALAWDAGGQFGRWVASGSHFLNTLVDRIVPGFPRDEAARLTAELGYDDQLLVATERFHLWVIEGPKHLADEIPFHKAGLNVVWTDDLTPYRTRKCASSTAQHTAGVLAAFLGGADTVGGMMEDELFRRLVHRAVYGEIVPSLAVGEREARSYAAAVLERFRNPFIQHQLLSIALNSVSKWKVRVLPSVGDFLLARGKLPATLVFSLAALIRFYDGVAASPAELRGDRRGEPYPIRDETAVLATFCRAWSAFSSRPQSAQAGRRHSR